MTSNKVKSQTQNLSRRRGVLLKRLPRGHLAARPRHRDLRCRCSAICFNLDSIQVAPFKAVFKAVNSAPAFKAFKVVNSDLLWERQLL